MKLLHDVVGIFFIYLFFITNYGIFYQLLYQLCQEMVQTLNQSVNLTLTFVSFVQLESFDLALIWETILDVLLENTK